MRSKKILLAIVTPLVFSFSQPLFGQGQVLADSYASGIGNYKNGQSIGNTFSVDFEIGNSSAASGPISPNSVEWTISFPISILKVGTGVLPTGFYEDSRTIAGTTMNVHVRNNTVIPPPTPFIAQDFVFSYPVTGIVEGKRGSISIKVRHLNGFSAEGNIDINNDKASSSVIFSTSKIELITDFMGSINEGVANLHWTVLDEIGIRSYEVLRSTNSVDFTNVETVNAKNSIGYRLIDNVVGLGNKFHYKLKINENDNSFRYSKIIVLTNGEVSRIMVYPNPSSDVVNISTLTGTETISIVSIDGRKLLEQAAVAGNNTVNISKLASGNYSLVITNGEEVRTFKLAKN